MLVFEFLKKLLKKWYLYLSLIPALQGLGVSYFGVDVYIQQNLLWCFALSVLLCACYSVWKDQKDESRRIQEELNISQSKYSSFEVRAYLNKVVLENSHINLISRKIALAKNKIESLDTEIDKPNKKQNSLDLNKLLIQAKMLDVSEESDSNIFLDKEQLKAYRQALTEYINKVEKQEADLRDHLSTGIKNLYLIQFQLKNISKNSDGDIDLQVNLSGRDKFVDINYLIDLVPKYMDMPKRKKFKKTNHSYISSIDSITKLDELSELANNADPKTFFRYLKINETFFSVKVRDLKAGDTTFVPRKSFLIIMNEGGEIDCTISSHSSGGKLSKRIEIISESNIDYEEVLFDKDISTSINFLDSEEE